MLNYDYAHPSRKIETNHGELYVLEVPNFRPYQHIRIDPGENWLKVKSNEFCSLQLTLTSTLYDSLHFNLDPKFPSAIVCQQYYYEDVVGESLVFPINETVYTNPWKLGYTFNTPQKPGQ